MWQHPKAMARHYIKLKKIKKRGKKKEKGKLSLFAQVVFFSSCLVLLSKDSHTC